MKKQTKREQIARAKAARLMEQAQALGYFLKASVVRRRFRCGKAGCRCGRGYLHQDLIVTRRVAGISQTIRVRQGRETEALVWLENWRRLKKILSRLTDVEMRILRMPVPEAEAQARKTARPACLCVDARRQARKRPRKTGG